MWFRERVVGKSSVAIQWDPSKPDHLKTSKTNVQLREYYSFKGVICTGVGRNETTGHVWCRRDSGLIYITMLTWHYQKLVIEMIPV